eukprot:910491-Prymnesium_polylepis.1
MVHAEGGERHLKLPRARGGASLHTVSVHLHKLVEVHRPAAVVPLSRGCVGRGRAQRRLHRLRVQPREAERLHRRLQLHERDEARARLVKVREREAQRVSRERPHRRRARDAREPLARVLLHLRPVRPQHEPRRHRQVVGRVQLVWDGPI